MVCIYDKGHVVKTQDLRYVAITRQHLIFCQVRVGHLLDISAATTQDADFPPYITVGMTVAQSCTACIQYIM